MFSQFFADRRYALWAYLGWFLIFVFAFAECFFDTYSNYLYQYFTDSMQSLLNPKPGIKKATREDFMNFLYYFFFIEIAGVSLCNSVRSLLGNFIAFKWRTALNNHYVSKWEYLRRIEGASQRVQEDCQRFTVILESIALEAFYWLCRAIAFSRLIIIYGRELPYVPFFGSHTFSLLFASISFELLCYIPLLIAGIKLPSIEYENQVLEASYRKRLIYSESTSVSNEDLLTIRKLFINVRENSFRMYKHIMFVDSISSVTRYFSYYLIDFLVIPGYLDGNMGYGRFTGITEVVSHFLRILSYIRDQWSNLIELLSVKQRLDGFEAYLTECCNSEALLEAQE
ncbi:sensitivity to microcin B17 [Cryptosporidium bovis]|uniref:sensitivity to microcin B17 n=1 Tax=Cryptosporidium bovis TaxID=310047 RepID=UPI00351A0340|nr:sensitivity to microcin B17 [Cryptosporidium bovis]